MKCADCKRVFNAGSDWERRIETYVTGEGVEVHVGHAREAKTKPEGSKLRKIEHYKCFLIRTKRETRADESRKSLVAKWDELGERDVPGTRALVAKMAATRQAELEEGYGKDMSWSELEKARAEAAGGTPYDHDHPKFVMHYQLAAHLLYAHGISPNLDMTVQRHQHDQAHAFTAQQRTRAVREADPGYEDPGLGDSDWRHQEVWNIEDLPGPGQV